MSRSAPEWIGKTDDTAVPDRVRVRVRERDSNHCKGCGCDLGAYSAECDHVLALVNGGENRETNLQTLCVWCHREKTAIDSRQKSSSYKRRKHHYGVRKAKSPIQGWRRFDGTPVRNPKLRRAR